MKALRFNQTGDLNHLEFIEFTKPTLNDDEVLVQIKAARLNSNDLSNVMGRLPYTTTPRTPGRDYAGIVVEGPSELIGLEVWGSGKENGFSKDGSHAEFMKIHRNAVSPKPKSLTFPQAGNCGTPYITAWHALASCGVSQGTSIAVIGANGAVGNAAMELALQRQAQVLGLARGHAHLESIQARGAKADSFDAEQALQDLPKTTRKYFPNGPDVIFDTTGLFLNASIAAVGQLGKVAVIVAPGDGQVSISVRDLYRNGASIVGVNSLLYSAQDCAAVLRQLANDFDAGLMQPPHTIVEHELDRAKEVYMSLQKGLSGMHVFIPHHG